ncbi:hypothetical protein [Prochlorococcus marinus]|uniref:Uncharacterized protein n=1 Tax=Prochlorococcus marinus (strain MIT 9211) TaxID=93059 RepID=A9BBA4_PROM4|nr:hypothetical protein [Prochlorococcus marinus]ABX09116.1 Hypothetical protein P9211_11851 [Prochlorococcus marinus str. MIT 9211]
MLVLFVHLFLGFVLWTTFAIINKGQKHHQINETLIAIFKSLRNIGNNIKKLIQLLVQDLLEVGSNKMPQELENINANNQMVTEENYASTIASISNIEVDEDLALDGFSPEVVDLINEEEEKAA